MEYRILGPLEVHRQGQALRLGGIRQRALLALLLLRPNEVVPTDRLIDALWDGAPPPTGRQSLQNGVAALRRTLVAPVLVTRHPGYLLRVEPGQLDLHRFRRLVAEGRAALADGAPSRAANLLRAAAGLWRGAPLADLAAAAGRWAQRADLEEERVAALELRLDADLARGRHGELVGELEELVTAHPLRERLHGQLMLALYRSGRQADALAVYARARAAFVGELGIEPGPELRALQFAILAQDESVRTPGGRRAAAGREERRLVTVLFAAVDGPRDEDGRDAERDPEDVRTVLAEPLDRVRAEVERAGGVVQHVVGGTTMALFGAPRAHGDDPQRAVHAALAARDGVASASLSARAAVATGEALVSPAPLPGAPAVAGAVVTAGARLLEAAPAGRVLVTPATARASHRSVAYRPIRPTPVAGRASPPAFEALRLRARPLAGTGSAAGGPAGGSTRWTGRAGELAGLADRYHAVVRDADPHVVTLVGDPGIGKSRLVAELHRHLDRDGARPSWCRGRTLPYGQAMTFWALAEIVKLHAGILETDTAAVTERKLSAAVAAAVGDADRVWVARHLRALVGGEGARPGYDSHQAEAFAAWRRYLAGLARRGPLVCVFEDLHWADDTLLDFVDDLPQRIGPVPLLVLVAARPELLERRPGWGATSPSSTRVPVGPLGPSEASALVGELVARHRLGAELAPQLVARVGGNPLFAEEYVRMLADHGERVPAARAGGERDGGERVGGEREPAARAGGGLPLPESVHGIIAARLDRLPPEERGVLEDAAVVGRIAWDGAVATVGGHDPGDIAASLRRLEQRALIRRMERSRVAGQQEFSFAHMLVRDVAYARIPRAQRAQKHGRAAAWIAGLPADRAGERTELLAHHYQQALAAARAAGQETRELARHARDALHGAGDRAAGLRAYGAAARFYAAALDLWPREDPRRPRLLLALGAARFHQEGDGEDVLTEARDALRAAGDHGLAAEAEVLLGLLAWRQGRDDRPAMRRALGLVAHAGPSPSKAFVLSRCALRFAIEGRTAAAITTGREALVLADRLRLPEHAAKASSAIGMARVARGEREGLDDLERAAALLARDSSPVAANVLINLATMRARLGDLPGCFAAQERAQEVAERFGSLAELRWLEAEKVHQRYWTGHAEEAAALAGAFISASQTGTPHYLEPSCRVVRGRVRLARGDRDGALDDAQRALGPARRADDTQLLDPALAFMGSVLVALGRHDEASALAAELLVGLAGRQLLPEVGVDLAQVLAATGHTVADLDAARMTPSPWLDATRAFVAGDRATAAARYRRIGSVPDAQAAAAGATAAAGFCARRAPAVARSEPEASRRLGSG